MAIAEGAAPAHGPAKGQARSYRKAPTFSGLMARFGALAAIVVCAAPAIAVFALALLGARPEFDAVSQRLLLQSIAGTFSLVVIGAGAATLLGASAALLVTLCRFPGRGIFEWMLVLPLAAPVYVLAYAYSALTWTGGPIPAPLTGIPGAAFIYAFGFFPYVYLAARAAFASQSVCALEAARSLGARPWQALVRVALPMARPGIAAGAALAAMEIAADYGAAMHFGASTITTGIFRAWFSHGDTHLAFQLAAILLAAAILLLWVERASRGRQGFAGGSTRWRPMPRYTLGPVAGWSATLFCTLLVVLGALLPLAWLARLMLLRPASDFEGLSGPLVNSLLLAGLGGAVTLALAALVASAAKHGGALGRGAAFAAAAGYAAPGAVIALGALSLFGIAREAGFVGGLGAGLSIALLVWSYAARFAATGAQPIEAGMARITRNISGAARSLGAGAGRRLFRIDLPLAGPSVIAAALIVFVEILKELPATLLLRPYFDTLAVRAYTYASDERFTESAAPALMLVLAGVIPILILSRQIARARAGVQ